jgi:4-amino-4-deoxy-L-arabinose transferase-like glycosyltransferase
VSSSEALAGETNGLWRRAAAGIETAVDRVAASRMASLALIVVVALACFLPGFLTLPPVDRDEPRFAQATHQMVETGNYFDIRFQSDARYKKPIGIYWLQSAAVWLTGTGPDAPIWVYRLPSLIGGVAAALLTWWLAMAFGRPRLALLAGSLVATTVLMGVEARLAKTDMTLLVLVTAAHGALLRAWLAQEQRRSLTLAAIFWTAIGASILIKGPVGPAAILCPIVVLSLVRGSGAWLKPLMPLWGILWTAVLVAPWFIAIGIASHGAFYSEALGKDLFQKVASAQESHGAPPGAYVLTFLFTVWPVAAFFAMGFSSMLDRLKQPLVLYAAASVVPYWLAIEAVPTKLPHYILPLLPLMVLAAVDAVEAGGINHRNPRWLTRFFSTGPVVLPVMLLIAAIVIPVLFREQPSWPGLFFLVLSVAIGLASWRLFRHSVAASLVVAGLAAMVTYWGTFGAALPHLQQTRLSERLVEAGRAVAGCPDPDFVSAGYEEPSLVLVGGTDTLLADGERAAKFLADGPCRVAFIEGRQLPAFNSRADDLGIMVEQKALIAGYNINGGRKLEIRVFVSKGIAP